MPSRNEIVALLRPHVRFDNPDRDLDNLPAFCPFHKGGQERSPSMYVYVGATGKKTKPGHTFCHTCQTGWTLSGLLKKLGVDVPSAWDDVLDEEEDRRQKREREKLDFTCFPLPEAILGAWDYGPRLLLDAGFTKDTLQAFEVGFDRRLRRVTFPIRNHLGELVGVSGRSTLGVGPRYKIYTTELQEAFPGYEFKKGRVLWGLHRFYRSALDNTLQGPVIVCEGFKAAMWLYQHGYNNVVALIGASATREQRYLLQTVSSDLVVFLDNDNAGLIATTKLLHGLEIPFVRVADYGTKDPDSPDDLDEDRICRAIEGALHPILWRRKYV